MASYEEQSHGFTHDVFLSFRGEDTRYNIVGYLREGLRRRGINVFYDDKSLRIGEDISPAFYKAIEESNISVIVLSEDYASSRWCLDELAKIMECTKSNNKQIAFPIFYHVDPSDVRNQRNSYGKAMVAHQKRFGKDSEKIKAWTAALSDVANLKGHHIDTGNEIDHVKEIAEKVHANIAPKPLLVGENPVGLEKHVEEVKSLLALEPNDDIVCMLGIIGLGGIGKTELAKALYNKIVHQFEAASFLANVREKWNKINGPEDLQKTLLSEMFERSETEWGSTSKGIYEIKHKLGRKNVLLVLDDVDEMEQLRNLAGGSDWFGPGSRIIITTRDKGMFMNTHSIEVKTYEMTELNDEHSLELFCRNAFAKSNPQSGYEVVSSRAVGYAKGLPLALKVIGSNLKKKSLKAWESALKDYEMIPSKEIHDVLKVSYDVLESNAQSVFLDIACFFKGKRIEYVEEILDEFSASSNIEELINKSLLNVDNGYLNMHDLIHDMGREIVRQEAPNPAGRSRLWFQQDVIDVLSANDYRSDAIQGIMLDPLEDTIEVNWDGSAFEKMNRLRILIVRNTIFSSAPKHLPNYLRLLDWKEYPSKTFPPKFYPKEVIILSLSDSQLTIEEPLKRFKYLTIINFSFNQSITTLPDVSKVEKLRELRLDDCENLTTVHESIGFLKHLVHLSASGCTKLENFLQRMFLPSLEVLKLDWCEKLEHFPDIENEMNTPLKIHMMGTSIKKLPNSVGYLIGLVSMDMQYSENLEYLPSSLFKLPYVVAFDFGSCCKLGESFKIFLPHSPSEDNERSTLKIMHFEESGLSDEDIEAILICFPKLEELIVYKNDLVSLSACIKKSAHLTNLDVSDCKKLKEIPECTNLRILNVHGCMSLTHISELPCTFRKIDARKCFNFSSETSNMLWDQVKKEEHVLEIVMPGVEVPKWFNYICKDGIPCFWVREKLPNVSLALVFQYADGKERINQDLVQLHLVINGQPVPQKGYYNFIIEPHHVLVCDLRLLYTDEEWLSIDALLLKHEWNQVQISYEFEYSLVTLSEWGVFVYKQGTDYLEAVNLNEQSDGFTYDVFLSFRVEDMPLDFIAHLHVAFQKRGIHAFYDDESLRIGEEYISPALCKAIEESNISVIVLSENYASSRRCLDELAKIMECTKRNNKQIVFPILYHVDPSDVRHQRNSYGEAMVAHQNRFGKDSEKIKAWTAALFEVADFEGHHIHTGHEMDHIIEIAGKVDDNISKPLFVKNPVGLDQHIEEQIEEVKSLLDLKPNDNTVCFLGIIGLGGIGKTELAKALYQKIVHQFEEASFLANVREKWNKINGPEDLQKTLLSEMFEQSETEWGSTSKGIYEIKHKLGRKNILMVLDDVDEMEQLRNLAGGSDWFGPGSRIIITTRDKGIFMNTHSIEVKTYEMTELNVQHSLELFCRNAFGKSNPKAGYGVVSYRAIGYAKGLPLALKVIGSNLATRESLKDWEDALKDYERIPCKEIQDVLKVSYDVLEPYAQSFFLDIACFFKGKSVEYVKEILEEFSETLNIEELVNKSLLNVDNGYLNMHDLIQDMGREIVRQEAPNNPAKFNPMKVIILTLVDSRLITMEEPFKQFIYLTVMNFSFNQFITTLPDVSKVENLRELQLDNCKNLTTVHESIGFLKNLVHLSASRCYKLENFLQRMFLPSLEVLELDWCKKIKHFPDIEYKMNTPLKIHMMDTSIKKLPSSVGNLLGLVSMDMKYCRNLEYLPSCLFKLPNVVAFDFGFCSKLGESFRRFLPHSPSEDNEHSTLKTMHFQNIGLSDEDIQTILVCFPKLEELNVSYNYNLVSLPACIKNSNHLKKLNVPGCTSLAHILELPCTIQKIDARYCFNFSSKTSDMLWDQVTKERHGLEIVMPKTKVPKWFDYRCKNGIPCLWIRGKFPINVVLSLVFQAVDGKLHDCFYHDFVRLHLVINGQSRKGYYGSDIEPHHVLVCDLRLLYNDEEWLSIDALLLKHEWNQVQISYEFEHSLVTLSEWGVFVYKQGRTVNLEEHVQFMCPDPTRYSNIANTIVPPTNPMNDQIMMMEELDFDEILELEDEIRERQTKKRRN